MASTAKKNSIIVAFRMPRDLHAKIMKDAEKADMTLAATIRKLLTRSYRGE